MQRKDRVSDDSASANKTFFERHPVLRWTLIGFSLGLLAAAVALSLVITLGVGIQPFINIGMALGIANATAAATAALGIIAAGSMAVFGFIFGGISAIAHRKRSSDSTEAAVVQRRDEPKVVASVVSPSLDQRAPSAGMRLFNSPAKEDDAAPQFKSASFRP